MRQIPAFPRIPESIEEIRAEFGDIRKFIGTDARLSPDWEKRYIVRVDLPEPVPYAYDGKIKISRIAVHRRLRHVIMARNVAIWEAGLEATLGPYGGGYEPRANRNDPGSMSLHSYGLAEDWNPVEFPNRSAKRRDPRLVEIMAEFGFMCGQDFKGTKDPMHFQFARNV